MEEPAMETKSWIGCPLLTYQVIVVTMQISKIISSNNTISCINDFLPVWTQVRGDPDQLAVAGRVYEVLKQTRRPCPWGQGVVEGALPLNFAGGK